MRSGFVPRSLVEDPFGAYRALQVRDFSADGSVDWERLTRPRIDGNVTRHEVRDGDLIVALRGVTGRTWQVSRPPSGIIVLGHFAILTATPDLADPFFLLWYLNHPSTKTRMQKMTKGSSFPFLPMGEFRRLAIVLPPLAVQRAIGQAHTLAARGRTLQQRISALRQRQLDLNLMRAVEAR